jgi:predicted nucleotidyltransferase
MDKITESPALSQLLPRLRASLPDLITRYQIVSLGIFGSYVRGEERPDSDLDLLVEFSEPPTLFGFIRLENELNALLGIKVDLVMKSALKPDIGRYILKEVQPI